MSFQYLICFASSLFHLTVTNLCGHLGESPTPYVAEIAIYLQNKFDIQPAFNEPFFKQAGPIFSIVILLTNTNEKIVYMTIRYYNEEKLSPLELQEPDDPPPPQNE